MWGHLCQCLFYLEVADYLVVYWGLDDCQVISLHAITGIRTEEMMHLHILIGSHRLLALLDGG